MKFFVLGCAVMIGVGCVLLWWASRLHTASDKLSQPFAAGGEVAARNSTHYVGERGPEWFTPR